MARKTNVKCLCLRVQLLQGPWVPKLQGGKQCVHGTEHTKPLQADNTEGIGRQEQNGLAYSTAARQSTHASEG